MDDTEEGFAHDATAHFGRAEFTVNEYDGYFNDFESQFPCFEFEFDLESVPFHSDPVEVDCFEDFSGDAYEPGG
jgi:hypothetical protein